MSEPVRCMVVERIIERQSPWINPPNRLDERVADALHVGNDFRPDPRRAHRTIVELAYDSDPVARAGDDQCRLPSERAVVNEGERGIPALAALADEDQPGVEIQFVE